MRRTLCLTLVAVLMMIANLALANPININQANPQQISESLVGVGLKKAQAIVDYREQYGDFTS